MEKSQNNKKLIKSFEYSTVNDFLTSGPTYGIYSVVQMGALNIIGILFRALLKITAALYVMRCFIDLSDRICVNKNNLHNVPYTMLCKPIFCF